MSRTMPRTSNARRSQNALIFVIKFVSFFFTSIQCDLQIGITFCRYIIIQTQFPFSVWRFSHNVEAFSCSFIPIFALECDFNANFGESYTHNCQKIDLNQSQKVIFSMNTSSKLKSKKAARTLWLGFFSLWRWFISTKSQMVATFFFDSFIVTL